MLSRPEIGSREHIKLWLASKQPDETYVWENSAICACGQYATEYSLGIAYPDGTGRFWSSTPNLGGGMVGRTLNALAHEKPHTFGALYERAVKAWE